MHRLPNLWRRPGLVTAVHGLPHYNITILFKEHLMSKHSALTTFGRSGNPMFRGETFKPDATFAGASPRA
ncbi:MAG: hypothetical protein CL389_12265 [Acidiferrobacteraceae bacterium]|jgi:hypothetical protein|nr:hypothetical protein [Acidiferrobacteraceae bacterium]